MEQFEDVWQRIVASEGSTFHQVRGKAFTYSIIGGTVVPSTTNRNLPKSQFAKAYARRPLRGPAVLQDLQGPSYLYAILTDQRIERGLPESTTAESRSARKRPAFWRRVLHLS